MTFDVLDQQNAKDVPWEAQLKIFGFAPVYCKSDRTYIALAFDPLVRARIHAILDPRLRLEPVNGGNIFGPQYKLVPLRKADANATDPANIISTDDACTFNVVRSFTETELADLRARVIATRHLYGNG